MKHNHHYYRKLYKLHFGEIPTDKYGRSYEIHHKDGNCNNNNPSNLVAMTIQEHYDIHYENKDYSACRLIALRMNKSPEEISFLAKKISEMQIKNKTHPWIGDGSFQRKIQEKRISDGTHNLLRRSDGTSVTSDRVANGTHPNIKREDGTSWASDRVKDGTHNLLRRSDGTSVASDRVANGTHHFLGSEVTSKQLKNGTHPSQQKWKCEICGKIGFHKAAYTRFHGKNCKSK